MSIPVVPTPLTPTPPMIYGFRYTVNALELNSYITFNVILLDQNNSPLSVSQVTLAGNDYTRWGNSDQYVIQYICTALGLTLLEDSTIDVPTVPVDVPTVDVPTVPVDTVVPTDPVVDVPTVPTVPTVPIVDVPVDVPTVPVDVPIVDVPTVPVDPVVPEVPIDPVVPE